MKAATLCLMRMTALLSLMLVGQLGGAQVQQRTAPRKSPAASKSKPECAQGSICFSGEVQDGQEFRRSLSADLDFVLRLPGGIDVLPTQSKRTCELSAWVANPPLMAHHDTEIDAEYDWTAEMKVQTSPREFRFPTNCADYKRLYDLSQGDDADKYFANLTLLAKGKGRLWITDFRSPLRRLRRPLKTVLVSGSSLASKSNFPSRRHSIGCDGQVDFFDFVSGSRSGSGRFWVRLRLRAALWRQWKTQRRRRAALLELGVRPRLASNTAGSGRGPWYLARAKALSVRLSNEYFKSLGLPSLFEDMSA
jgi:hypothetical protein